jgi:hypothetical protein
MIMAKLTAYEQGEFRPLIQHKIRDKHFIAWNWDTERWDTFAHELTRAQAKTETVVPEKCGSGGQRS